MSRRLSVKKVMVKYPVKLGYNDKSGRDSLAISDKNSNTVVFGNSDDLGIASEGAAKAIIKALNATKPRFYVKEYYWE